MNKSDNCQNCDAKDKVTIAGKTFCSNCGTPDSIGASQDAQSSQTAPQTPTETLPTQSTVSSAAVTTNTADTAPNDLADSITQSLSSNNGTLTSETKPAQPSVDAATPIADLNNASTTIDKPVAANPDPSPVATNTAQLSNPPISQASNIQKFNAPVGGGMHTIQPESASTSSATATDLQNPAATPIAANTSTPPAVDSIKTSAQNETLGSEISTLDSSDDHVFSDDQFSALAKAGNDRPIDVAKLSQKPVSRGVRPMTDITASAPTQPGQIVTPTNSVAGSNLDTAANVPTPKSTATQPNQPLQPTPAPPSPIPAVQPTTAVSTVVDQQQLQTTQSKEHKIAKKGAKIGSVAFTAVGILLLGAYVWQVNYPNLALKVASSKAGISASIPSYLPSGWQVSSNINSSPGSISYELISSDGKATATINEKKTDWDSQALAENYVNNQSDKYLALQAEGLTIYVYKNQASWVNNGTWYRIEGANTGLSQDQLIRMATSL